MAALTYLLDTLAGLLSGVFLLRFLMQLNRVSFANPLGSFVVTATNWAVKPLRRVLPGVFGLDLASVLPAYLVQCGLLAALLALRAGPLLPDGATLALLVLWQGLIALVRVAIWVFIAALFLQAVLSWVNPWSPLAAPVGQFTRPVLAPIRRFLPPIGGLDLSPLLAIVLLQALLLLL